MSTKCSLIKSLSFVSPGVRALAAASRKDSRTPPDRTHSTHTHTHTSHERALMSTPADWIDTVLSARGRGTLPYRGESKWGVRQHLLDLVQVRKGVGRVWLVRGCAGVPVGAPRRKGEAKGHASRSISMPSQPPPPLPPFPSHHSFLLPITHSSVRNSQPSSSKWMNTPTPTARPSNCCARRGHCPCTTWCARGV